jgi:hypothetical protein
VKAEPQNLLTATLNLEKNKQNLQMLLLAAL